MPEKSGSPLFHLLKNEAQFFLGIPTACQIEVEVHMPMRFFREGIGLNGVALNSLKSFNFAVHVTCHLLYFFIGSQVCTNAAITLVNNGSQFFWCPLKRADESAETKDTECCGEPDQQVCCAESDYVSAFVVESSAPSLSPQ